VPGAAAALNGPWGASVSADGATLFIADTNNGVVRALRAPSLGGAVGEAPFQPGNVLAVRQGAGMGAPVFIDQYSPAGVLVSALPIGPFTTVSGAGGIANLSLCMGADAAGGKLALSADGALATLAMAENCGAAPPEAGGGVGRGDAGVGEGHVVVTEAGRFQVPRLDPRRVDRRRHGRLHRRDDHQRRNGGAFQYVFVHFRHHYQRRNGYDLARHERGGLRRGRDFHR
jgi:hypothetical protein